MIPVFMLINIHVYGIILTAFYFLFLSVEKRLFFLWIKIYNRIKQENNKIFDYLIFSIILIFECTILIVKKITSTRFIPKMDLFFNSENYNILIFSRLANDTQIIFFRVKFKPDSCLILTENNDYEEQSKKENKNKYRLFLNNLISTIKT